MSLSSTATRILEKPMAIAPLVTFRIFFGATMTFSAIRFVALGWIDDHFVKPIFHFKYFGFGWIEVLPAWGMYATYFIMILAAICVMLGCYYRVASIALFLTFTYTELADLTYYLNHYYFVTLVCALMMILPAHRYFSIDTWRKPSLTTATVPAWTIFILQFQIAVVYIFAGLTKINYDWLVLALPMRIWLPAHDNLPILGKLLAQQWTAYLFSWAGMIYDCTIVFWLAYPKTRIAAFLSVIVFHVLTGWLFQIGVFPIVMILAAMIFFSPAWHDRLLAALANIIRTRPPTINTTTTPINTISFVGKIGLTTYIAFQILFPLRSVLYPGKLFWTEQGFRFSWRVMLMEKAGTATFYVKDSVTQREGIVINSQFLNEHQENQMATQPDMILQYAHFLKDWYGNHGVASPQVRAEVYVTLNGRPGQLLIDPNVNLAALKDGWAPKQWILLFRE